MNYTFVCDDAVITITTVYNKEQAISFLKEIVKNHSVFRYEPNLSKE